jgi:hypothetical protein
MSHLLTNFCPPKKMHTRGLIVFTTFILHSLCPIVFLEIVKEQKKIKTSILLFWKLKMQPFYLRSAKTLSFSTWWANERCSLHKKENLVCNSSPSKIQHTKQWPMKMHPQISMFNPSGSISWCEWRLVLTSSFPTLNLNTIESPRV